MEKEENKNKLENECSKEELGQLNMVIDTCDSSAWKMKAGEKCPQIGSMSKSP